MGAGNPVVNPGSATRPKRDYAVIVAIIAALATLGAGVASNYVQGRNDLHLERSKFESELILRAISTGNLDDAKTNLEFFIAAGYIRDQDKIEKITGFLGEDSAGDRHADGSAEARPRAGPAGARSGGAGEIALPPTPPPLSWPLSTSR